MGMGFGDMVWRPYTVQSFVRQLTVTQVDFGSMELANPLQSGDVLNDFDFDSFLHDGDGDNQPFDFNNTFASMDGGEIGAD